MSFDCPHRRKTPDQDCEMNGNGWEQKSALINYANTETMEKAFRHLIASIPACPKETSTA